MNRIYNMLKDDSKKLGLFSSPTGTGKSLSLVCSILSYHMDKDIKPAENQIESGNKDDTDEWENMFSNKPIKKILSPKKLQNI
jgi:Rad3-related DNA helicase